MSVFANEVKQLASVKRVGFTQGTPFNRGNNNTVSYRDKNISFQILGGDTTSFNILGLQIVRDNQLGSTNNHAFFSRQAMKETELEEDATEIRFNEHWSMQVDGIINDIQLGNITNSIQPLLFFFSTLESNYPWDILVEIQGDPSLAFDQVKQAYERIVQLDFNGKYIEDQVLKSFTAQQRTAKIVILFTAIAILISLLGLLAMSTYFIRQHTKEIAVRKVHGADNFKMLSQLILTFLGYVGIAFVIAVPIIGYIMNRWLLDYSYRISLSPWIFISAGAFCLLVSFVSVYWQSRLAANADPVNSLKNN